MEKNRKHFTRLTSCYDSIQPKTKVFNNPSCFINKYFFCYLKDAKNLNLNKCDFVLDEKNDRQVKASLEFYTYYIEKI